MQRGPGVGSRIYRPAASRKLLPGPDSFAACVWRCSAPGTPPHCPITRRPAVASNDVPGVGQGRRGVPPVRGAAANSAPRYIRSFPWSSFCLVRHSGNPSLRVALCVDGDAEHSAVPDPKGTAFHLFFRFMNLYSCKLALG